MIIKSAYNMLGVNRTKKTNKNSEIVVYKDAGHGGINHAFLVIHFKTTK
jgi:hypothetical protein